MDSRDAPSLKGIAARRCLSRLIKSSRCQGGCRIWKFPCYAQLIGHSIYCFSVSNLFGKAPYSCSGGGKGMVNGPS